MYSPNSFLMIRHIIMTHIQKSLCFTCEVYQSIFWWICQNDNIISTPGALVVSSLTVLRVLSVGRTTVNLLGHHVQTKSDVVSLNSHLGNV